MPEANDGTVHEYEPKNDVKFGKTQFENVTNFTCYKRHFRKHIGKVHEKNVNSLRIASLNIGRGLFKKEELLINTINEQDCDIFCVSEVDIKDFDENKPFSIEGFRSFFPLQRPATRTKRLLCFVKEYIEVIMRTDLMSNLVSSVWLEVKGTGQKTLICATYREFSDLTVKG